jgi:hypothetical protein
MPQFFAWLLGIGAGVFVLLWFVRRNAGRVIFKRIYRTK